ncbi:type II 3-dehydroquinate dehydratase [Archangium sp.]|uniref:type II 3-dehydroquinate dehydratase n=1 Tax=Archangium sp. TaxID=1872627 RepID=UPI00286B7B98|nr:type II 3-dehydroquinate dehydratase [Archangium sp.]
MGKRLLVLHGPNLNLLGEREGRQGGRLADLDLALAARAKELGLELKVVQSNHEGVLIDTLQAERSGLEGVVVSPAGLFGSYPLREALEAVGVPAIEVYVGALGERESVVAEACAATIDGQGFHSYLEALERFAKGDLTGELSDEEESSARASEGPRKTLGRKVEAAPASPAKTLGRKVKGAEATPAANVLSRALVRQKIADRLAGKLTPSELASWARTKWTEVQTGAAAESGQRELLEDSLQRLTLSAMPASKLSDSELLDMMTRLER